MSLSINPSAEALIFDLDGTLIDSIPVHMQGWKEVCAPFNYTFTMETMSKLTGAPTRTFAEFIIAESGSSVTVEDLVFQKQQYYLNNIDKVKPIKEVVEIVFKYSGKMPMAIGTGASRKTAIAVLSHLNLLSYFDHIVTADDVESHKPFPETFLKCAELMKVSPYKCQVFEDGELGLIAATKAGMIVTDVRPTVQRVKV